MKYVGKSVQAVKNVHVLDDCTGPRKNGQELVPHPTIPGLFSPATKSRRRGRGGAGKPEKIGRDEDILEEEFKKEKNSIQVRLRVMIWVAILISLKQGHSIWKRDKVQSDRVPKYTSIQLTNLFLERKHTQTSPFTVISGNRGKEGD